MYLKVTDYRYGIKNSRVNKIDKERENEFLGVNRITH